MKMTGFTEEEVIGKPLSYFFADEEEKEEFFKLARELGKVELFRGTCKTKDQRNIFVETNAKLVYNSDGEYEGIEGIFYDVTKQRQMEVELEKQRSELEESNRTLAKAVKELDRFVYSASHDLVAPLKSIMGLVNIAKLEDKDKKFHLHLDYIEQSIIKQESVINSLIQYSKNERQDIVKEQINLYDLIGQITIELRYMPGTKDVEMINNLSEGQAIISDRQRMTMILINLISNGIKYRDHKKNDSFVKIEFEEQDKSWCLIVKDNGLGIAEDEQEKIFDMFYRANIDSDGSGLGLFIVHEAVERLGGTISLKSEIQKGTTFRLKFPKYPANRS